MNNLGILHFFFGAQAFSVFFADFHLPPKIDLIALGWLPSLFISFRFHFSVHFFPIEYHLLAHKSLFPFVIHCKCGKRRAKNAQRRRTTWTFRPFLCESFCVWLLLFSVQHSLVSNANAFASLRFFTFPVNICQFHHLFLLSSHTFCLFTTFYSVFHWFSFSSHTFSFPFTVDGLASFHAVAHSNFDDNDLFFFYFYFSVQRLRCSHFVIKLTIYFPFMCFVCFSSSHQFECLYSKRKWNKFERKQQKRKEIRWWRKKAIGGRRTVNNFLFIQRKRERILFLFAIGD